MSSFMCPFCNSSVPIISTTYRNISCFFNKGTPHFSDDDNCENSAIFQIDMFSCPECNKVSFVANGKELLENISIPLYPNSLAKQFPDYIPQSIREDYQEAYSIINLSPKASATLARRCLQGMIRDFFGIVKPRLVDEITALQSLVPPTQWKAIDSLRSVGNIGAHMESDVNVIIDVDPDEAQKLLKLIELLVDKWYISRHDEEQLLYDITAIADDKKSQKQIKSNQ